MLQLLLAAAVFGGATSQPAAAVEDETQLGMPALQQTFDYLPYYLPSSMPRPGTREIWQYYGVDRRGRWVPRVIQAPLGAYYYYNGAPFPYTTTRPSLYMPYVVD
jgi:hypothetical protein